MKFIKYPNGDWWEWDVSTMRAFNISGGHHYINENSLGDCEYAEYKSWNELYKATGFNPLVDNNMSREGWISPNGDFYPCTAHEVIADSILLLLYDKDCIWCGDKLVELGWIKVTNSMMFPIYYDNGMYKHLTEKQSKTFAKWREKYGVNISEYR